MKKKLFVIVSHSCILFSSWVYGQSVSEIDIKKDIQDPKFNLSKLTNVNNLKPVVILGSGPAGLTAALYTSRAGFNTLVVTGNEVGGQLTEASYVENWPAKEKMAGADIMKESKAQAEKFGAELLEDVEVTQVDFSTWPFILKLSNEQTIRALSVIIATGGSQRTLNIPGVKEFWGKGIGVCSICDAPFDKGKTVAVIGGGDAAADRALQLSAFAKQVTVLVRASEMRAADVVQGYLKKMNNINILYNVEVKKIIGKERVEGIEIMDAKTGSVSVLPFQSVYFALGFVPRTQLFMNQLVLDPEGYVKLFNNQATSKKGVFAAGTVEDSRYQKSATAAGNGSKAGMDAIDFLQSIGFTPEVSRKLEPQFYKISK